MIEWLMNRPYGSFFLANQKVIVAYGHCRTHPKIKKKKKAPSGLIVQELL